MSPLRTWNRVLQLSSWWPTIGRVASNRQAFVAFAENLAELLTAGIDFVQAVDILSQQGPSFQRRLSRTVSHHLERGFPVSQSLLPHIDVIAGNLFVVSERVGQLPGALAAYVIRERARRDWRQHLTRSLIYPFLLMCSCLILATFVRVVIQPQLSLLEASLEDSGVSPSALPVWSTLSLCVIVGVLGLPGAYFVLYQMRRWGGFKGIRLPFDDLVRNVRSERFVDSLHIQLASGVSLVEALSALCGVQNSWLKRDCQIVLRNLLAGISLANSLPNSLSPIVREVLSVSEVTGDLTAGLRRASDLLKGRVTRKLQRVSTWLEPVTMSIMGLVVGTTMYSVFGPMYHTIATVGTHG
ncbi:type II secretion system F family protein [Alicyclobacillus fastidiosus]|uniref:Type II secretion system F family protein n=1 Tax=Alicyclobacillus fastidiosus TaxID=392011 RepID=A0ABY6ZQP0_9BACL|nr:type II secretion system F family protein [Alicyclobacillus fastidiosus]WAH44270.1 type II secretion system F family protein [Alicyclobacillus fastidiosus]GMA60592.1 type II secretion system protein [Alicyclobacillus fastidiosus]